MCHYLGGGLHGRQKRVKAQSESSKSVVNSVLISREMPVFLGFLEIIRVVLTKTKLQVAPVVDLSNEHADIINRLSSIYLEAPSTTDKAVNNASKALNGSNDNTYTDDEIDRFLPRSLRKGK